MGGRAQAIADVWLVRPASLGTGAGMNRFVWDLRYADTAEGESQPGQAARGPQVLPGTYQVKLTVAGKSYTQPLKVVLDPRSTATTLDLTKQFDLGTMVMRERAQAAQAMRQLTAMRRAIGGLRSRAGNNASLEALMSDVEAEGAKIVGTGGGRNATGPATGLSEVQSILNAVAGVIESADRTPPAAAYTLYEQARATRAKEGAAWTALRNGKLADLNRALRAQNLPEITL